MPWFMQKFISKKVRTNILHLGLERVIFHLLKIYYRNYMLTHCNYFNYRFSHKKRHKITKNPTDFLGGGGGGSEGRR